MVFTQKLQYFIIKPSPQSGFQAMTIFFKVYPRKKGAMPTLQELERKTVRHDM